MKKNDMERACEFCTAFKSVVYCKADAASLCLSCDAKVHSANALSSRHLRTLLCDSCRHRPCSVRCLDHGMFLCHGCDSNLHGVSSQHQRRVVSCYTGCPSAKDFAVMWGFRVNDDKATLERLRGSVRSKGHSEMLVSFDRPDAESSGKKKKGKLQRDTGFILEQILELEKLQLRKGSVSLVLSEETDASASSKVSDNLFKTSSDILQQSEERASDIPQLRKEVMADFPQSPFPQMEPLTSSSMVDNSFWQCKGPSKNYQLWYQNLQDIAVCEEAQRSDDFDIPDIDLTFRNFEELFGADQEVIVGHADDNMVSVSSLEIGTSLCKTKRGRSLFNGSLRASEGKEDSMLAFKPSSASLSHTLSRFSGGSSGTDCHNSPSEEVSCCSPLPDDAHLGSRQNSISRLKEKKKARAGEKQTQYVPRKARSEARKRASGGFASKGDCSSDTVGTARSY